MSQHKVVSPPRSTQYGNWLLSLLLCVSGLYGWLASAHPLASSSANPPQQEATQAALAKSSGHPSKTFSPAQLLQQAKLTASDGATWDLYGRSVALSGDTLVVGADFADVGANSDQGAAYVYVRNGSTWTFQAKLTAGDGATGDKFGAQLAITGDTIVAGAAYDTTGVTQFHGSAYVFVRTGTTWTQQAKLSAADTMTGDHFGNAVALNGETVIIGAFSDDIGNNDSQGSAYVFVRNGTVWTQQQKLTASDGAAGDFFGTRVALNGDTALAGAPRDDVNRGAAYVFVRNGTVWTQQQKLTASDGVPNGNGLPGDYFGGALALSGETALVGAENKTVHANQQQGAAYIFTRSGTVWTQAQKLLADDGGAIDVFGISVALSGNLAIIGAAGDNVGNNLDQGSAYVFRRTGAIWAQQQKVLANDGAPGDVFAFSTALSGNTVAFGAELDDIGANTNQGSAYVFVFPDCPTITLTPASLPTGMNGAAYNQTLTASGGNGPYIFTASTTPRRFDASGPLAIPNENPAGADLPVTVSGLTSAISHVTVGLHIAHPFTDELRVQLLGPDGTTVTLVNQASTFISDTGFGSACTPDGNRTYFDDAVPLLIGNGHSPYIGVYRPEQMLAAFIGKTGTAANGTWVLRVSDLTGFFGTGTIQCVSLFITPSYPVPGLSLQHNGMLSGTATTTGNFNLSITATDANGCTGTQAYTHTINPPCPAITLAPNGLPNGFAGVSYSQTVSAQPAGTYSFTITNGNLPAGLTLNPATGVVSGTPTTPGISDFTITATNSNNCAGQRLYRITINSPMTTITVNSLHDAAVSGNGQCTLREALNNANVAGQTTGGDCAAGAPATTINFSVTGILNLTGALPVITSNNLTINGPGAAALEIRRNTGGAYRIFLIPDGKTVSLAGLTLSNGQADASGGGAIFNNGNLSLSDCVLSSNTSPTAGGGLLSAAAPALFINNCQFNGNSAGSLGGGLAVSGGPLTLTNSTLSSNSAGTSGTGQGGGADLQGVNASLTNCTISGNTANNNGIGSGLFHAATTLQASTLTLLNCTLTGNTGGGGLRTSGGSNFTVLTQLKNTLAAANTGANFSTLGTNATLTSQGHNLDSDGSSGFGNGVGGNLVGTAGNPINALLAALANNGGPTTTHALLPGSPAINAGNNTGAPATDQRGIARPQQPTADIGAYESRGFVLTVTSGNNQTALINTAFANSLVATVSSANGEPVQGGRVAFAPPGIGASAVLTGNPATIQANGQASVTASANNLSGSYNVNANTSGALAVATFALTNATCTPITVNPVNPTLPNGRAGTMYSQTFTQTGGGGAATFTISAGALPNGVMLAGGGLLSGAPIVNGTFGFTIRATAANNCFGERAYTLVIQPPCPALTVTPATLANGFVGTAYNQMLTASGGTAPYTFTVTHGSLPAGLTLDATSGVVTGTPTTAGTSNFTVTGTDNTGCTGTRAYTVIISGNGLLFYPLATPVRLLDTRPGASLNACSQPNAPIAGGTARTQPARNFCTIPAQAVALTGNVTTVQSNGAFLTLYPSDAALPTAASTNFTANEIVNNVFTVGLGAADGAFNIYAVHNTDVVVDVTGYFAPPAPNGLYFHPLPAPVRLLETRAGFSGCVTPGAALLLDTDTLLQARTPCTGIPSAARAIVGNATTVNPRLGSYITLYPANVARPFVATSNFYQGQTVNGPFTVGLAPTGEFLLYTTVTTDLVVDVLGYYSSEASDVNGSGLLFTALTSPVRLLETRADPPTLAGCYKPHARLNAQQVYTQPARGVCQGQTIAANALAVVGNATVVFPTLSTHMTFWPSSAVQPNAAMSNYTLGSIVNRHFIVGLGALDGAFKLIAFAQTDLVIDLTGYFAP